MSKIDRRNFVWQSVNLLGLVGLSLVGCTANQGFSNHQVEIALKTIKLESNVFKANTFIPVKYTCDGEGISPPLKWSNLPQKTQSLTLIVDDPDAPNGTFVHWVIYDLSLQTLNLAPAIPATPKVKDIGIQGKNSRDKFGYTGPCPPNGTHRYFFKLYALDNLLRLDSGVTKDQVIAAMDGHILATGELIGRYQR